MVTAAHSSDISHDELRQRRAEWEIRKVGDRLGSFSALLPAYPSGPVLLAVGPELIAPLLRRYPGAQVLDLTGGDPLPRQGQAGMIVVDSRLVDPAAVRPLLAEHGVAAVIGRRGRFLIYPDTTHPEQIWRRGWPVPAMRRPLAQARRSAAIRLAASRGNPRLSLRGPAGPSTVDLVLTDLGQQLETRCDLVGITTAGHTVLRVRSPELGDLAVRLSLSGGDPTSTPTALLASEAPTLRRLLLPELARGSAGGYPWVATAWIPARRRTLADVVLGDRRRWRVAEQLVVALHGVRTGETGRGWARRWADSVGMLSPADHDRFAGLLAPLDAAVPTGWCHGDPWPANILLENGRVGVIDWDNARPDAPLGIDWLLVAALHVAVDDGISMARACAALVDDTTRVRGPVGGRLWGDWDRRHRSAFAAGAFLLHLRNRSLHDLGVDALAEGIDHVFAVAARRPPIEVRPTGRAELARVTPPRPVQDRDDEDEQPTPVDNEPPATESAGRVARGALWLGASSVFVKAAQTAVLLILAALLAPSALGVIALGTLIANIASVISDLGTSTALVYWRGDVERAARTSLTIALITNVAIVALVWVLAPWLVSSLHAPHDGIGVLRGLVAVLPCYAVTSVSNELMRRNLAFVRRVLPDAISAGLGAGVAIVLALTHHGVAALVTGQIVQGIAAMVIVWIVWSPVRPGWNGEDARGLIGYGGHLTGADIVQLLLLNIDYLMVSRVLGGEQLGQYSLAYRLAYLPFVNLAYVIAGAAFPYLCRLEGRALGRTVEKIVSLAVTLVAPVCLGITLLGEQLELLGHKWAPAVGVVRWLGMYALLLSVGQFVQTALNASGRPKMTLQLRLAHLVVLGAALAVVVHHGIVPVAVTQVIVVAGAAAVTLTLAHRVIPGFAPHRLARRLLPAMIGAAAMIAVTVGVHAALPSTVVSVWGLCLVGTVSLLAYAGPVWLLDRDNVLGTVRLIRAGRS